MAIVKINLRYKPNRCILSWGLTDAIWGTLVMIFVTISMFFMNWKLALITIAVLPILAVVSYFFQTRILKQYRRVRKMIQKLQELLMKVLPGNYD